MNSNPFANSAAVSAEDPSTNPLKKDSHSGIFSLDVLRGLALFGLLIISIREFGGLLLIGKNNR